MVLGLFWLLALSAIFIVVAGVAVQWFRSQIEQVKQLGQYTLERQLGAGGMGEVHVARHAECCSVRRR